MSDLSSLVAEVRAAAEDIKLSDRRFGGRLDALERDINTLYKRSGRPAGEGYGDDDERTCAVEMLRIRAHDRSPRDDGITTKSFLPSSSEIEEAQLARRAFTSYLRAGGDLSRLDHTYTKALSAFSFGGSGYMLPPQTAPFTISCLSQPSNLSGLVDSLQISSPSLRVLIDNANQGLGVWACESSCYGGETAPDLLANVGQVEIKPETLRLTICSTRDLLEDASIDVENWVNQKIQDGLRATINAALLVGDGAAKPLGLLNPRAGIPIAETAASTPPGQISWADLVALKYTIPVEWHDGAVFLMNQTTFSMLLTMQDAIGRPIMMNQPQGAPVYSIAGSPVVIATQMPDIAAGSTPVLFGSLKRAYLVVWRKAVTVTTDPYSAGFCVLWRAEARVGGAPLCPNACRLLRVR